MREAVNQAKHLADEKRQKNGAWHQIAQVSWSGTNGSYTKSGFLGGVPLDKWAKNYREGLRRGLGRSLNSKDLTCIS